MSEELMTKVQELIGYFFALRPNLLGRWLRLYEARDAVILTRVATPSPPAIGGPVLNDSGTWNCR